VSDGVSLVVTVKNERRSIERFLTSVLSQTRLPEEIVVVDGGSDDGTLELLRERGRQVARLIVVEAPGSNIAAGRNIGIGRAASSIVAVADAGTELDAVWLERLLAPLESDVGLAASSGFFRAAGRTWFEQTLSAIITPQLEEVDPDTFLPSSRSAAYRRGWWRSVGGYPEWLDHCEDLVFNLALREAGARFAFVPDAVVSWTARSSLRGFFRQYFNYARGDGHALLWTRRHAARYMAYVAGASLAAATRRRPAAALLLLAGVGIHLRPYAARLARRPPHSGRTANGLAFVALPAIVVTGDVAKMIGYPVGLAERATGCARSPTRSEA
jgi:glycosyltransferase involved in cell wall biosynthesis